MRRRLSRNAASSGGPATPAARDDWRICRAPAIPGGIVNQDLHRTTDERVDRFGPIADELPVRRSVTDWIGEEAEDPSWTGKGRKRYVTAGILIYRLLQSGNIVGKANQRADLEWARGLLTASERAAIEDVDSVVADAVAGWHSLRSRKDVVALLAGDRLLHEVPFSMAVRQDGQSVVLRGVIDCLVQKTTALSLSLNSRPGIPSRRTSANSTSMSKRQPRFTQDRGSKAGSFTQIERSNARFCTSARIAALDGFEPFASYL